jgi:hypothetical protein
MSSALRTPSCGKYPYLSGLSNCGVVDGQSSNSSLQALLNRVVNNCSIPLTICIVYYLWFAIAVWPVYMLAAMKIYWYGHGGMDPSDRDILILWHLPMILPDVLGFPPTLNNYASFRFSLNKIRNGLGWFSCVIWPWFKSDSVKSGLYLQG